MPRTVTRRLTQRQNVPSPAEQTQSPGYRQVAPMTSYGYGGAASAIAAANELTTLFTNGGKMLGGILEGHNKEQFRQGEIDARTGNTDPIYREKVKAYNDAATQVEAEAMIVQDEVEIEAAAKPFIDSGDLKGLQQFVTEQLGKKWSGVNGSEMEAVVLPWMQKLQARLAGKTMDNAAKLDVENNLSNLQLVADGLATQSRETDGAFDYAGFHERSLSLFPGADTYQHEAAILSNVIERGINPHVYDSIPERNPDGSPTVKSHPIYGEQLRTAYVTANAELAKGKQAADLAAQSSFFENWKRAAKAGQWRDPTEVDDALMLGWITPEQRAAMLISVEDSIQTKVEKAADTIDLSDHFENGTAFMVKGKYADEDVNDDFDAYVEQTAGSSDDPNALVDRAAALSARNGELIYRPLKSQLSGINLDNPQRFGEALSKYERLYAINPQVADLYVGTEEDRKLLLTAATLKKYGRDPVQVLTEIGTKDLKERREYYMEGDLRKEAIKYLKDAELGRPGRFFDRDLKDLPVNSRAMYARELGKLVDTLGIVGAFTSADQLIETASKMMESRYMVAGDRLMVRPKNAPADADKAMTWFVTEGVQQQLAPTGYRAEDVELILDNRSDYDGTYRLIHKTTLEPVLPDQRFRMDEIVNGFRANGEVINATKYQTKWQAVIDQKDITTPGAPALMYSSTTLPSIDKYAAERRFLSTDQRRVLDAKFLPEAERQAVKSAALLNKWQEKRAIPHAMGIYEKKRETQWAKQKYDYWTGVVADLKKGLEAPVQQAPASVVARAASAPSSVSQKMTARDWQQHKKAPVYRAMLETTEQSYGLPRGLLGRVAFQESRFNPEAYNKGSGASGLMQIVPKWHPGVNPWNPNEAVPYAAKYLTQLHQQFGSWDKALAAYNWGPQNLKELLSKPEKRDNWVAHLPKETRNYIRDTAPNDA